jgi:signal transduction histidine kinase
MGSHLVSAYAAPIFRFNRSVGTAWVFYKEEAVQQRRRDLLHQTAQRLVWLTLGVFGVALLLSASLSKTLTRPISEVVAGARRLGRGELGTRVREMGPGELGDLGREFNAMAQKLGDLEAMKDHFIQTVSHDLRNPLSAIATSANVLLSDELPATSLPLVEVIESSAVRLRTMVNNILDVAKMREGRLTFERTIFPVSQILKELTRLYLPMAKESNKTLHLYLPEDLPLLDADEEKVLRIFLNLLTNAFKFTREGDTITIAAAPEGENRVEFRVSDTGLGIDPVRLATIFQPFRSVEGAESGVRHRQGTGLGLSIVKTLIEGHGGRIQLQSIPGKGTTVVFTLPCQAAPR